MHFTLSKIDVNFFLAVKPGSSPKLEYQRGSLVWAKVPGYPSWPAMIDDDPDYSSFFWIDEASSPVVKFT